MSFAHVIHSFSASLIDCVQDLPLVYRIIVAPASPTTALKRLHRRRRLESGSAKSSSTPRDRRLRGRANHRPVEKTIHPRFQVWQTFVDGRLVALPSDKERNVGDVREGIVIVDIFPALHFAIQSSQVFFQLRRRLFDFVIMGYLTARML